MRSKRIALVFLALYLTSCKTPPVPPETKLSEIQEQQLWRAGASVYAPQEYEGYLGEIRRARQALEKENLKLGWFRRYDRVQVELRKSVAEGNSLLEKIRKERSMRDTKSRSQIVDLRHRIRELDEITISVNERGKARYHITRAVVLLDEAEGLTVKGNHKDAEDRIAGARESLKNAEAACLTMLGRYNDPGNVNIWKRMAEDTIDDSRKTGGVALVVAKLERRMLVYRRGVRIAEYGVGLGLNGLADKLHSGDNATPEGKYRIVKKIPGSQFYKALLINYPNDEDRQRFAAAKRRREIPYWIGIGNMIEIHGGGKDCLTRGCISTDDRVMDELFPVVSVGTPVTIVGTLEKDNPIFKAIRDE